MKKFFALLTILILTAALLVACGCDHDYAEADCNDPKTCTKCGATEGEELGHDYAEADCNAPKTCTRCGKTRGDALGHEWVGADCDNPEICSRCNVTGEAALGHSWVDADCTNPKTCSVCAITEGEALGHVFADYVDCANPPVCGNCGIPSAEAKEHTWAEATCDTPQTCTVCAVTEGEALGHSWIDATYEAPKTCAVCGLTEGEPLEKEDAVLKDLGIMVTDYNAIMNEMLAVYGAELIYVSEDTESVTYMLYDGNAGALLEIYVFYYVTADGNVSDLMVYTANALEESEGNWIGIVGSLGMMIADPSITTEDLNEMMSQIDYVDEEEYYTYIYEKNGLIHTLTCNDTTGEAYFWVYPAE